jgi:hypothetical protein
MGSMAGLDRCPNRDSIPGPSSPYRVAIPTELSRPTIGLERLSKSTRNLGYSADRDSNLGPSDTKQRLSVLRTAFLKSTWNNVQHPHREHELLSLHVQPNSTYPD